MKKVSGVSFGVRFYRRGIAKVAVKEDKSQEKGQAMNDSVMDIPAQDMAAGLSLPAAAEKELLLHEAARSGDCYALRVLVMDGVDLEAVDAKGRTALDIATQYNRMDAVKTLLAAREMRRMASSGELLDGGFFKKFKPDTVAKG